MHTRRHWCCLGFVIMPDHFHVAFKLLRGDLSTTMNEFGKFTGRRINSMLVRSGRFWQPGFYDRAFRNERECMAYLEYMLANPVRAGFAPCREAWPYQKMLPDWTEKSASGEASYREDQACP